MRKNTTIWKKKKYGKKTFVCKRDLIRGFCFHEIITTDGYAKQITDFYESCQDAKRDGWEKVPR